MIRDRPQILNELKILVAGEGNIYNRDYYYVVRVSKKRVSSKRINNIISSTGEIFEPTGEKVKREDLVACGESIPIEPESSLAKLVEKVKIETKKIGGKKVNYIRFSGINYQNKIVGDGPESSISEKIEVAYIIPCSRKSF